MVFSFSHHRVIKNLASFLFRPYCLFSFCLVCSIVPLVRRVNIRTAKNIHENAVTANLPKYPYELQSVACSNMKPLKILCACVVGSSEHLVQNLIANMIMTQEKCDWAVVSYDSALSAVLMDKFQDAIEEGANIVMAVDGKKKVGTPKVLFWPQFIPLLSDYDFVWFLDEDLSFHGFDFDSFTASIGLSFPNGLPLISQPVLWTVGLDGITPKDLRLDNSDRVNKIKHPWYWIRRGKEVAAAQVGFVEIQAPLVDASFFEYLMKELFLPSAAEKTGTDWGLDIYWCKFAERFAMDNSNGKPVRPFCAVVPITPLLHLNFKSLKLDEHWSWKGSIAVDEYEEKFPHMSWSYEFEKEIEDKFEEVAPDAILRACAQMSEQ